MAEERVTYLIEERGGAKTAGAFDKVAGSMKTASVNSEAASQHFANLGGAVGNVGTVVAQTNPQLGAFAGVIGTAGSAVSALTASLGGPLGLVAGGAVAALGIFVTKQKLAADAAKDTTKELEKQRQTVASLTRDFAAFGASQKEAELRAIEFQLQDPEGKLSVRERERLQVLRDLRQGELGEAEEGQRLREEQRKDQEEFDRVLSLYGGGPAERKGAKKKKEDIFRRRGVDEQRDLASGIVKDIEAEEDRRQKARLKAINDAARKREKIAKDEAERIKKIRDEQLELDRAREQERVAIATGAFQIVGSAGIQAFADLAKGQEVSLKQIISGIGDQMVAEGTKWIFTGTAKSLLGDPSGPALIGVGGAEVAAGIALGAATRGSAGSGGGSGGSRATEPTRFRLGNERTETQVVNVNVNTMVADANAGKRIKEAIRESDRIHGRAA